MKINMDTPNEKLTAWLAARTREAYKPHFRRMNSRQRAIYREILWALVTLKREVLIPLKCGGEISEICQKVLEDNAVIFYAWAASYSVRSDSTLIRLKYDLDVAEIERIAGIINASLEKLAEKCKGASPLEKEIEVHNLLVKTVTYDLDESLPIYKAHAPFVCQRAVCSGISFAASLMLSYLGVEAFRVTGDTLKKAPDGGTRGLVQTGHAWNMVRVGRDFYHLDITFDNGLTKDGKFFMYDYFNLTDEQARLTRVWYEDYFRSGREKVDYYTLMNLRFDDKEKLFRHICERAENPEKPIRFALEGSLAALTEEETVKEIETALTASCTNKFAHRFGSYTYMRNEALNTWQITLPEKEI